MKLTLPITVMRQLTDVGRSRAALGALPFKVSAKKLRSLRKIGSVAGREIERAAKAAERAEDALERVLAKIQERELPPRSVAAEVSQISDEVTMAKLILWRMKDVFRDWRREMGLISGKGRS